MRSTLLLCLTAALALPAIADRAAAQSLPSWPWRPQHVDELGMQGSGTPADVTAWIRLKTDRWGPIVKAAVPNEATALNSKPAARR